MFLIKVITLKLLHVDLVVDHSSGRYCNKLKTIEVVSSAVVATTFQEMKELLDWVNKVRD